MTRLTMIAVAIALHACMVAAQPPATVIAEEAQRYRFDLTRFFANTQAEIAARAEVDCAVDALAAQAARVESAADLLAALTADDRANRLFRQHDLYLFLRYAVDIREEAGMADADTMRAKVRAARQILRSTVAARSPAWVDAAMRAEPELARYRYFFDTVRRDAGHALGAEQQAAVAALEPLFGAGDYPRVVSALTFGDVHDGTRLLNARRDRGEINASVSEAVRREGSQLLFAGYGAQRDLLAYMLVRTIDGANAVSRMRGHASAAEEAAFSSFVDLPGYEVPLAETARHGEFYKNWQQRAGDPFAGSERWRPTDAAAAVVASAGALGPVYRREIAELLDPANGRADLSGGEHRLPITGTASVYPTGRSSIYMQVFQGTLLDLIVLAHEGGHAVQAQLMARGGVPMVYAAGPGFLTESYGRFQELLLLDHLWRHARSSAERGRMRDALAARLMAVFPSFEEAAIELAIHKGVDARTIRTADDLDAATAAAGAPYSDDYRRFPERRGTWMLSEGYFMAPMQELNDAYASLLAVRYFQNYRRDPERFRTGYLALLSGGYDAAPAALLRRHMGIDMAAPAFVPETMATLRRQVDELYR